MDLLADYPFTSFHHLCVCVCVCVCALHICNHQVYLNGPIHAICEWKKKTQKDRNLDYFLRIFPTLLMLFLHCQSTTSVKYSRHT